MNHLQAILDEFPLLPQVNTNRDTKPLFFSEPPRAILFDVYGTLFAPWRGDLQEQFESKRDRESFLLTARRFGFSDDVGVGWAESFYNLIEEEHEKCRRIGIQRAEVLIEQIWERLIRDAGGNCDRHPPRELALFREMLYNPVAPFAGVKDTLKELKRRGLILGLVSNAQFYTLLIIKKLFGTDVDSFFDPQWLFLSYRLGFAKPDPHFFRLVRTRALRSGLKPQQVVVVGNNLENDIHAACRHGLQAVLFAPHQAASEKRSVGQWQVIVNFETLLSGTA